MKDIGWFFKSNKKWKIASAILGTLLAIAIVLIILFVTKVI